MEKQTDSVTLAFIVCRDYATEIHSFESLGIYRDEIQSEYLEEEKKYGYFVGNKRIEIVSACFKGIDELTKNYFKLASDYYFEYENESNKPTILNQLVKAATGEYICFVTPNTFVKKYWLEDLLFYATGTSKCGAVGISGSLKGTEYLPLLSGEDENLVNVFVTDNHVIEDAGIWLTSRQNFYFVGAFNDSPDLAGHEFLEWQMRAFMVGLSNFYIPTQTCFQAFSDLRINEDIPDPVRRSIAEKRKAKNYYLPL